MRVVVTSVTSSRRPRVNLPRPPPPTSHLPPNASAHALPLRGLVAIYPHMTLSSTTPRSFVAVLDVVRASVPVRVEDGRIIPSIVTTYVFDISFPRPTLHRGEA